jgi:hypothetical protein
MGPGMLSLAQHRLRQIFLAVFNRTQREAMSAKFLLVSKSGNQVVSSVRLFQDAGLLASVDNRSRRFRQHLGAVDDNIRIVEVEPAGVEIRLASSWLKGHAPTSGKCTMQSERRLTMHRSMHLIGIGVAVVAPERRAAEYLEGSWQEVENWAGLVRLSGSIFGGELSKLSRNKLGAMP